MIPESEASRESRGSALLDLSKGPPGFLDPIARVVDAALGAGEALAAAEIMVVGAWSRDVLHAALGHQFETTATRDVDLALALTSWSAYRSLIQSFSRVGDSGIRYRIADIAVDLLPFGRWRTRRVLSIRHRGANR